MGYKVDVRRIEGVARVVNYICKYITGEKQNFDCRFLRRIQCSSGIGSCNPRSHGAGWNVGQHVWQSDVGGRELYDQNLKLTIKQAYWQNNHVYPPEA